MIDQQQLVDVHEKRQCDYGNVNQFILILCITIVEYYTEKFKDTLRYEAIVTRHLDSYLYSEYGVYLVRYFAQIQMEVSERNQYQILARQVLAYSLN